ncbi:CinA family protein [Stutzerimonas stutzeri]|uniref:CinA family protein n=1 Tax=Stutzerimonas sp. S1 TaxID=3030652 RepID=UPI00222417EA|nr:CinA family protein [Stutzerimonas sp. S1]MCW3148108.1 CinA family protein [Stutzerimonas sp. S1]
MQSVDDVVTFLRNHRLTLATAESCTCGLMASLLGDIPGCGQVLDSGFVVYSPAAKHRLLQVNFDTIERYGLTSEEVATEMAIGALHASSADFSVANTGVADDAQADEGGTQCYAWALRQGERVATVSETVKFEGDRVAIRKQAARHGLSQLRRKYAQLQEMLAATR